MNWVEAIHWLHNNDKSLVIVTVLEVEGSAPRDVQSKMVVWSEGIFDSIGGGNLEFRAIAKAKELLDSNQSVNHREWITLGKDLSQCCGGRVELLFECIAARNFNVVVLGAGHVGKSLIRILADLPCRTRWLDNRKELIDTLTLDTQSSSNVSISHIQTPESAIDACPENAYYLIVTHSHELDMQLVEAILSRNDIRFCGLIGSKSKAAKFRNRLKRKQFSEAEISNLTCPMGNLKTTGKSPMEVAVSIAAQLLEVHHKYNTPLNHATVVDFKS